MREFLSILWGPDAEFEISCQFPLLYRGDSDGEETFQELQLSCPDRELRSFVLSGWPSHRIRESARLVSVFRRGQPAAVQTLRRLRTPPPWLLLLFALQHQGVSRSVSIVVPEFFHKNPIAMVPNNGHRLLCAPPFLLLSQESNLCLLGLDPQSRC